MNITFENGRAENEIRNDNVSRARSNVDRAAASHNHTEVFALDISGTVMDNTAYEGQGKTTEDVMQDAGQVDVVTQKNYMAVMSNTMSGEDFARLQEEGCHPGSTDIETVVTIVDEIKAALVKGGKNITGYNDDLDVETLTQITGNAALAEELVKQFAKHDIPVTKENVEDVMKACEMVTELDSLSDGVVKYMLRNELEPTVDNLYRAQYSAAPDAGKQGRGYYQDDTGYYAKKAEEYNWQQLRPQMEKVIESAGLEVSDETLADAGWLVEKGMPLTEEGLNALYTLRHLEIPDTMEQIVSAAAAAIAGGKNAGSADISDGRSVYEKAADSIEAAAAISDEAVDKTAAEGKVLNLRNLKAAQVQISLNIRAESYAVSFNGRRLMEEVRLQMSMEANIHLIKSGFSIDTAELEQLVEALKQAQQQVQEQLFGEMGMRKLDGAPGIFNDTLSVVKALPGMPAALVGKFAYQGQTQISITAASFTLEAAYQEGTVLQSTYEKAGETYETLMTAPRADLGDSIQKAFRNVDELLEEANMAVSETNRRAVRILGYNGMEITQENVDAVKTADLTLRRVLEKMTPASTLQMIRDGVNPLSLNMEELETYLNQQERNPEQELEKYSEYLYKLERNNSITGQERESYIGIYRLFRQLEKTDSAAIGTLLNQGTELTVKNLLSAMRSNKKHGMDVTVDDSFGGIASSYKGKSISEQIGSGMEVSYYKKLASDIYDHLDGGRMNELPADGELSLEQAAELLQGARQEDEADREYIRQQAGEMRKAVESEDFVIRELLDCGQSVTADHLLAAGLLLKERGKAAERLSQLAEGTRREEALEAAVNHLQESMDDAETAASAYEELQQVYTEILDDLAYGQETAGKIDLREIGNLYKQISLNGSMAKEEAYEVPVNIDGEVTSVRLKIIHNSGENGKVDASMESAVYGKVSAQFMIAAKEDGAYRLSGYIACGSQAGTGMLQQSVEGLKETLEQSDIKVTGLHVIYNAGLDLTAVPKGTAAAKAEEALAVKKSAAAGASASAEETAGKKQTGISVKKLYDTAKIFIGYIQKGEGTNYENML